MKSITLYTDRDTPIHRVEPLCKVLYVLAAVVIPPLTGSWVVAAAIICLSAALLALGQVLRKTLPLLGFSLLILVTVVVIQGLFRQGNATPVLTIGPAVFYREGLLYALGIVRGVVGVILSIAILILTTRPSELVEAFVRIGLSPRLGYVVGSVFQIVPQMSESMETITDAQRSRGMETEGSLVTRVKAFFPLISPVVMNSLIMTKERAIALEVRGFGAQGPQTFLNEAPRRLCDRVIKLVLAAAIAAAAVWRVILWLA